MPQGPQPADFVAEREVIRDLATAPVADAAELSRNLSRIYHDIIERDLSAYTGQSFRPYATALMDEMFFIAMTLRNRIAEWQAAGLMTLEVQIALRDVMRALRYANDMLGELNSGFSFATDDDPPMRAFRELAYNTFVHPRFDEGRNLDFRSGDVLVVRGTRHNSAAIARIGDVDSQFSHASIVHFDESGQGFVVESLIEDGAVINPLTKALDQRLARALLLRHPDAQMAARASQLIFDHVKRSREKGAKPILYDFTMKLYGYDRLFCSKLIRLAFEDASDGTLKLPAFTTRFDRRKGDFFHRIGVTAEESFTPGDLEIEPAFDLVAEWQDYRYTSQIRLQDLIMTKLFEWMRMHGYRFQEDFTVGLIARLGRLSTKLSSRAQNLVADFFGRIPPHMPRRTIATIVMLHRTAQPLLEDLQHMERVMVNAEGRPLHPREIFDHLEQVRWRSGGRIGYLVAPRRKRR